MRDFQNMVYATAYRLLADEAEAQDISQEVFLKAYERFDTLVSSPIAGGWLKTVTRNLCLNHLSRHRARWRLFSEIQGDCEDNPDADPPPDRYRHADVSYPRLDTDGQRTLLAKALASLPHSQRVALVLFHTDGMSYEEIGASLHISLAKVKMDIHRGRAALRRILARHRDCRTA